MARTTTSTVPPQHASDNSAKKTEKSAVVTRATGSVVVGDDRVGPEAHLVLGSLREDDVLLRTVRIERPVPRARHLHRLARGHVDRLLELVVHLPVEVPRRDVEQ